MIIEDNEEITFTPSSGNVFADLGCENPEQLLAEVDAEIAAKKSADCAEKSLFDTRSFAEFVKARNAARKNAAKKLKNRAKNKVGRASRRVNRELPIVHTGNRSRGR